MLAAHFHLTWADTATLTLGETRTLLDLIGKQQRG